MFGSDISTSKPPTADKLQYTVTLRPMLQQARRLLRHWALTSYGRQWL